MLKLQSLKAYILEKKEVNMWDLAEMQKKKKTLKKRQKISADRRNNSFKNISLYTEIKYKHGL